MVTVDLTTITIPTPEPYDAADPHRQRESLSYVLVQILTAIKQSETPTIDLDIVEALNALQFNNAVIRWKDFSITLTHQAASLQQT